MKKLLGTALSAALVFAYWPANAELLKNLKVNGGLDVQMVSARNVTDFTTQSIAHAPGAGVADFNDRLGTALTRLMLGVSWDLLDDVHSKVTFRKNDRTWGNAGGPLQANGGSQTIMAAGGVLGNTFVDEAYFKVDKVFGHVDTTVGRQFYGDPGDLIIYYGPTDTYGLFVNAVDGVRFDHSNDWFTLNGLAATQPGSGQNVGIPANTNATRKTDVRGFNVGVKNLPVKTNVFLWNQVTHGNGALGNPPANTTAFLSGENDDLWLYGLKLKGEAMGGWASVTAAANAGTNRTLTGAGNGFASSSNYMGRAVLLDLGYKADIANVGGITPWFNWGLGTGRSSLWENKNEGFVSVNSDYRPGVIYGKFSGASVLGATSGLALGAGNAAAVNTLGAAAAIGAITGYNGQALSQPGLTNRIIWGVGTKFTPAMLSKFTTEVSYWDFSFQRTTANAIQQPPTNAGNRHIGSEFDLQFDWKHSDNVGFDVGFADFQPGGYIKEAVQTTQLAAFNGNGTAGNGRGVNPVTMWFADVNVRF